MFPFQEILQTLSQAHDSPALIQMHLVSSNPKPIIRTPIQQNKFHPNLNQERFTPFGSGSRRMNRPQIMQIRPIAHAQLPFSMNFGQEWPESQSHEEYPACSSLKIEEIME